MVQKYLAMVAILGAIAGLGIGMVTRVDFSIVNSDTGAAIMRQVYTDRGSIGTYIPAGSYTITLHNGSIFAGETHTVTLTLNASY